jgi:hypothetical protein
MKTKPEPQTSNAHKTRRQVVECRFGEDYSFAVRLGDARENMQPNKSSHASKNGLPVFHRC